MFIQLVQTQRWHDSSGNLGGVNAHLVDIVIQGPALLGLRKKLEHTSISAAKFQDETTSAHALDFHKSSKKRY